MQQTLRKVHGQVKFMALYWARCSKLELSLLLTTRWDWMAGLILIVLFWWHHFRTFEHHIKSSTQRSKKMLLVSSKFIFFLPTLVIGQMLRITLNTLGKHQMMFLLMMINSAHTKGEKVIMCIAIHLIYMNHGRLWYNVLPLQVKTAIKQQPSYLQKIQLPKKSLKIPWLLLLQ